MQSCSLWRYCNDHIQPLCVCSSNWQTIANGQSKYEPSTIFTISGVQIRNHRFPSTHGTKPNFTQWKIKVDHNVKSKLAQRLYHENIWHVNIAKPIIFQFFIHIASFIVALLEKFYYFTSPSVPKLEAKLVVLVTTTRDTLHCWWSLLVFIGYMYRGDCWND